MPTLTVATLNLYGPPFRRDERGPLVVQQLLDVRPDIIGFQEVDLTVDRGNWLCDRFNELLRQADGVQYRIYHVSNPTSIVSQVMDVWFRVGAIFDDAPASLESLELLRDQIQRARELGEEYILGAISE